MIVRKSGNWTIWNKCHPSQAHCNQSPHKNYCVTDGTVSEFFDDWRPAEAFFIQKTGERSLDEVFIKKIA